MNIDCKNGDYINQSHREKLFKVNIDSLDGRTKHLQKSQVNIYTDGSKIESQCGTGFAIYTGKRIITKHSERLPDESTVFQAEVRGIQKAAETMLTFENLNKFKYIKIFTDSQATLLALNSADVTSKLVLQTKLTLNELAKKTRRITIVWIKAHVGHEGNELADELAKEGTKKKLQTCNIGIPHNNICLLYTSPSPRDS